jgi:hypothetical protein
MSTIPIVWETLPVKSAPRKVQKAQELSLSHTTEGEVTIGASRDASKSTSSQSKAKGKRRADSVPSVQRASKYAREDGKAIGLTPNEFLALTETHTLREIADMRYCKYSKVYRYFSTAMHEKSYAEGLDVVELHEEIYRKRLENGVAARESAQANIVRPRESGWCRENSVRKCSHLECLEMLAERLAVYIQNKDATAGASPPLPTPEPNKRKESLSDEELERDMNDPSLIAGFCADKREIYVACGLLAGADEEAAESDMEDGVYAPAIARVTDVPPTTASPAPQSSLHTLAVKQNVERESGAFASASNREEAIADRDWRLVRQLWQNLDESKE